MIGWLTSKYVPVWKDIRFSDQDLDCGLPASLRYPVRTALVSDLYIMMSAAESSYAVPDLRQ
jgi:hypothetical protein